MVQDTRMVMGSTVNGEAGGSIPSLAAKPSEEWNEDEGVLVLKEFTPEVPAIVSMGIVAARDPEKKATLKRIFLDVLRSTGQVKQAAIQCKIPQSVAFQWRNDDPEFSFRWDSIVKGELLPHLEAEAFRRAMNGSDLLLMFMMKAYDRERFDDKAAEKVVNVPSILVQIRDVDKSLVAITNSGKPMASLLESTKEKLLDAKTTEITTVDAEFEKVSSSNGPAASAAGASQK